MNRFTLRALLLLSSLAVACGDDDGPVFVDSGFDVGPLPDGGPDSGPDVPDARPLDTTPPTVIETDPADDATGVAPSASIQVTFSEAMDTSAGMLRVNDGAIMAGELTWEDDATGFTATAPTSGWPEGSVAVGLLDFTDEAGNALPTYRFSFRIDATPPVVVATDPEEGGTISARTELLRIDFSEPMDNSRGAVSFEGDAAEVTDTRWVDGDTIEVSVAGLAYESTYRLVLTDFADRRGTALDGAPVLGDGVLDFGTGADVDGPRVVDAAPGEGQVDVDPGRGSVTVVFDEAMDTTMGTATLMVLGTESVLAVSWSADAMTLTLDVAAQFVPNQSHAIALEGFVDVLGNALDTTFYLVDGALDFQVSRDLLPPFVGFSDPLEASSNGTFRRDTVVVFFSEEMDPSRTDVRVQSDRGDFMANGTWNVGNTRLTIDVTDRLYAGEMYSIDFAAFTDLRGTPLDTDHPYLRDGVLDWTLDAPTGESCRDALTVAQATVVDGVSSWTVRNEDARLYDGSASCDPDPDGNDSVVRYTKTTASASAGGTYLKVTVDGSEPNLEVLEGTCDPTAATANRLRCIFTQDGVGDKNHWESFHDVGPGDYYVWFGSTDDLPETDYTVTIEEVAAPPEGENCVDPWDTSSAIFTAGTGEEIGTWSIPHAAVNGYDRGVSLADEGTPYCDNRDGFQPIEYPLTGADGVIRINKASADTVLDIQFVAPTSTDSVSDATAEILDRCEPLDPATTSYACYPDIAYSGSSLFRTQSDGPAGDYFLWISADRHNWDLLALDVTVSERPVAMGDTCANAIPLAEGSNPVTTEGSERFFVPSCFDADTVSTSRPPLTWYRFTTTAPLTAFQLTAADDAGDPADVPAALIDATARREITCYDETPPASALSTWVGAGREVCVAVQSGTTTAIEVVSSNYDGIGRTVTDLMVDRPLGSSGSEVSWASDYWLSVTPTTLYMGSSTTLGILQAPRSGGARAESLTTGLTSRELGNDGVNVGEAVFILDDATRAPGEARIHRAINGSGLLSVTPWDTGNAFVNDDSDALAYDGTEIIFATSSASTTDPDTQFYAVSPTAPSTGRNLGSNSRLFNVAGLAVDATYIYAAGNLDDDTDLDGIYRIARADLGTPATVPQLVALVNVDLTRSRLALYTSPTRTYLYFRDDDGNVHVADVSGATPVYLGVFSDLGRGGDDALTITGDALYLFESETVSNGRLVRFD